MALRSLYLAVLTMPVLALLAACSGSGSAVSTGSQQTQANGGAGAVGPGFARFTDVPIPANNTIDLDRTLVLGTDRDWTGRLVITTSNNVGEMYEFYRREMPKFGWQELASVRSATSFLAYQLDSRVATIQVSPRQFGGATIDMVMAPRGQGQGVSGGGFAPPAAAPRGGVDSQPLSTPRR